MSGRRALAAAAVAAAAALAGACGGGDDDEPAAQAATRPARPPAGAWVPDVRRATATVWAVGDGADGSAGARRLARRIARGPVDRFLYLGDVYGHRDGSRESFRRSYEPVYGRLKRRTAPTIGNHEVQRRREGYDAYWRRVHGRLPPDYYAFRAAGWQILSLSTETRHGPRSPQVRWLRGQLRGAGTCRLAFWHRPRWSAGRHGDNADVAPLWNALRGRATIVVSGHDHDSQRLRPVGGLTQFVAGAGGREPYRVRRSRRLPFGNDRRLAALRLRLRAGEARYAFVTADGSVLDSGRIACHPAA